MGYSITTPCKSARARGQVVAFLEQHHRPFSVVLQESAETMEVLREHGGDWPVVDGLDIYDPTQHIVWGDGIAYGAGVNKVGFNFSFTGDYEQWMYALASWIALRAGRRRTFTGLLRNVRAYPYFTYDGEATPVLVEADLAECPGEDPAQAAQTRAWYVCDASGYRKWDPFQHHPHQENPYVAAARARVAAIGKVVRAELERLDSLWRAANP